MGFVISAAAANSTLSTRCVGKMAIIRFEKQTCGRCGGSGHHSYNERHGSICYGCSGSGKRLTRKGKAASIAVEAERERLYGRKPIDVRAGDRVWTDGVVTMSGLVGRSSWRTAIADASPDELNAGLVVLSFEGYTLHAHGGRNVRVWSQAAADAIEAFARTLIGKGVAALEEKSATTEAK